MMHKNHASKIVLSTIIIDLMHFVVNYMPTYDDVIATGPALLRRHLEWEETIIIIRVTRYQQAG